MKTPPTQPPKGKQKRAGKAVTGYSNRYQLSYIKAHDSKEGMIYGTPDLNDPESFPVAVLPTETAKQAKALVAFANLDEGEKRFALAKAIAASLMGLPSLSPAGFRGLKPSRIIQACNCADAILQATGHIAGRARCKELELCLHGLVGLGRKDTTNTKYDGYYEHANNLLKGLK